MVVVGVEDSGNVLNRDLSWTRCLDAPLTEMPVLDDGPVAFRFSLPWSGDPLFDDLTAKAGVDLALFGPSNSPTQDRIRSPFLPGKALKPPGLGRFALLRLNSFYSTRCQSSRTFRPGQRPPHTAAVLS